MPDIVDSANDWVEHCADIAQKDIRSRKPEAAATGYCLYCAETLDTGKRWCDGDCRDGWERERRRKR